MPAILFPPTLTIEDLLSEVKTYHTGDTELIRLAYDFAAKAHEGQVRKSGEPYIIHPLAASYLLATMKIEPVIIVATLLHDVPEDTSVTIEDIEKNFGCSYREEIKSYSNARQFKAAVVSKISTLPIS
jgi:GTP pyrophosphokinase